MFPGFLLFAAISILCKFATFLSAINAINLRRFGAQLMRAMQQPTITTVAISMAMIITPQLSGCQTHANPPTKRSKRAADGTTRLLRPRASSRTQNHASST
jgi:hypothetical protein